MIEINQFYLYYQFDKIFEIIMIIEEIPSRKYLCEIYNMEDIIFIDFKKLN